VRIFIYVRLDLCSSRLYSGITHVSYGFNISIGLHSVKQMEQLLLNAVGHYILYVMREDPMRFLGGSGKVVDRLNWFDIHVAVFVISVTGQSGAFNV